MMILGVDCHPGFQRIAFLWKRLVSGGERRLNHDDAEAEKFYREDVKQRGIGVG